MIDSGPTADSVVVLLLGALLQFPMGVLVYLDARRLDLEDPELYGIGGTIVPVGGFVVILHYLSARGNLPRRETGES